MKANVAPEKLYISDYGSEVRYNWHPERLAVKDIEYTRTDAFIEEAVKWLEKYADSYTWYNEFEGESGMMEDFIRDFRKYMEE